MPKNRLREFRQASGLSIRQLAKELGNVVSFQALQAIEVGRNTPTLKLARDLADYFEVPIETLFPREKVVE